MRKSASITGNRDQCGENDHRDQSCPNSLAGTPRRDRRAWIGPGGDIAGLVLRAGTERKHRESTVNQMVTITPPSWGSKKKHIRPQPFAVIFARQPVQVRARPLLPFGHATVKTGSAMPRPIASKLLRADYRWKIVSPL